MRHLLLSAAIAVSSLATLGSASASVDINQEEEGHAMKPILKVITNTVMKLDDQTVSTSKQVGELFNPGEHNDNRTDKVNRTLTVTVECSDELAKAVEGNADLYLRAIALAGAEWLKRNMPGDLDQGGQQPHVDDGDATITPPPPGPHPTGVPTPPA